MSEQLLGKAGGAGDVDGTKDGPGGGPSRAPDARVAPTTSNGSRDNFEDASEEAAGALGKSRKRRRGSRGGRGRRGAAGGEGQTAEPGEGIGDLPEDGTPVSARSAGGPSAGGGSLLKGGASSPATVGAAQGDTPLPDVDLTSPNGTKLSVPSDAIRTSGRSLPANTPAGGVPGGGTPAGGASDGGTPAGGASGGGTPGGQGLAQDEASAPSTGEPSGTASAPTSAPSQARKPKIGDTRPGSPPLPPKRRTRTKEVGPGSTPAVAAANAPGEEAAARPGTRQRRRGRAAGVAGEGAGQGTPSLAASPAAPLAIAAADATSGDRAGAALALPRAGGPGVTAPGPAGALAAGGSKGTQLDLGERLGQGRSRRGDRRSRPLGRYLMVVHVGPTATQIAILEGRTLIEHYVSRPADDTTQIDGNIYLGRVQNVLPGMEAAFVDIGTPKNAVLYRGDLRYDEDEVGPAGEDDSKPTRGRLGGVAKDARIEQLLRTGQNIICQVTKNPIGTKGARLTQEVSLPGRFVVLIPESDTYGISKRLADDERRRLRKILDDVKPAGHGLIVRTAADGASAEELERDVARLLRQWENVQEQAKTSRAPQLLYREPDLAVRVIREEFNRDYRGVVTDDPNLHAQVKEYVSSITPELADRVELVDPSAEALPLFERFRVHEQVHKALDRKVWLPSGGSLIIERTEALTVIDVNTGKNVGTSNLEETVFRNNLEAADEIARQLRLRDIGGIIVIDFIDMEVAANRAEVIGTFREALARDKTRTQVFDISELGLVEMTRKRISEGLVESYSETCPTCGGRGIVFDESLLG